MTKDEERKNINTIVGQVAEAEYSGNILAIGVLIIDKDGSVRPYYHVPETMVLAMLGACYILQRDIANSGLTANKMKDDLE